VAFFTADKVKYCVVIVNKYYGMLSSLLKALIIFASGPVFFKKENANKYQSLL